MNNDDRSILLEALQIAKCAANIATENRRQIRELQDLVFMDAMTPAELKAFKDRLESRKGELEDERLHWVTAEQKVH